MPPGNQQEAHFVTQKFSKLINKPLRFIHLQDSPLQDNSSDCGVFVCLNMRHLLLKRLLMVRTDSKVSMSLGGRVVDASAGRKEMLRIIDDFRREGERRRSWVFTQSLAVRSWSGILLYSTSHSPHPGRKSRSPPRIDSPRSRESWLCWYVFTPGGCMMKRHTYLAKALWKCFILQTEPDGSMSWLGQHVLDDRLLLRDEDMKIRSWMTWPRLHIGHVWVDWPQPETDFPTSKINLFPSLHISLGFARRVLSYATWQDHRVHIEWHYGSVQFMALRLTWLVHTLLKLLRRYVPI